MPMPRLHLAGRQRLSRISAVVAIVLPVLVVVASCSSSDERSAPRTSPAGAQKQSTTSVPGTHPSTGCGEPPAVAGLASGSPGDVPLTFDSAGVERHYRLAVPDSYAAKVPASLILNLHGSEANAVEQSLYSDLPRRGAARGAIVIAPDAVNGSWQLTSEGSDDDFLVSLVQDVTHHYCVALDRISVIGISLGAWKASAVACRHPDLFSSLVMVAEEVRPPGCPPLPVLAFHGTADHVVPYGEGGDPGVVVTTSNANLPGTRSNMTEWAKSAGCSTQPQVRRIGDDVELGTYPGCSKGIDVQLYTIHGGDHSWPGSSIVILPTTKTISATDLALDFFASHRRPATSN